MFVCGYGGIGATLCYQNLTTMRKLVIQLQALVNQYGYWSEQVREFNSTLDYNTMLKVNNLIKK